MVKSFDDFFRHKRVLVTGHTGFKGAWLCIWLRELGADVLGVSLEPPSEPSLYELTGPDYPEARVDIRDGRAVLDTVLPFRPEIVIHMAAQSLVRPSYADPAGTFETNIMGTVNMLEAVRHQGDVRAVVNVTSDKCYENDETDRAFMESDPMGGHDPYSASKGCAELVTRSYARSLFSTGETALASARAGNVIGGGDFAVDRLIPDMARAFSRGEPVHIRSPHATRPWQHVLEPLSGYLELARCLYEDGHPFAGGWNFGPDEGDAQPVGELVNRFCGMWGTGATCRIDEGNHPHEAHFLRLDCSKARKLLGWAPRTDLNTALKWTVEWYRAWTGQSCSLRDLTVEQIHRFEALR